MVEQISESSKKALSSKQKNALIFSALLYMLYKTEYVMGGLPALLNFVVPFHDIILQKNAVDTLSVVISAVTVIFLIGLFKQKKIAWGVALIGLEVIAQYISSITHVNTLIFTGAPTAGLFSIWLWLLF